MMGYYDFGYGMGLFGWIMMVLFWGAVIWLIVWLVNQNRNPEKNYSNKTAYEILKERYAKGEISKKEYNEIKKEIGK